MRRSHIAILILILCALTCNPPTESDKFEFLSQSLDWNLKLNDSCIENWQTNWFLDGLRGEITNTKEGMVFSAGPVNGDDSCHAVLWTKKSFDGDIKIEYEYTRTDTSTEWVNILYIQATGNPPYSKDIKEWSGLREIPSMRLYYLNMNALHISYAAYKKGNTDINNDYIRARKYPKLPGQSFSKSTEIFPDSFHTGLFLPDKRYKVTVIKIDKKLYFEVKGENSSKLFSWNLTANERVMEGRIGLRHMYTRSALYKNFKIYIRG